MLLVLIGLTTVGLCQPPVNIYVDVNLTGGAQDGMDWTSAYHDLQSALNDPLAGTRPILVAEGVYNANATGEGYPVSQATDGSAPTFIVRANHTQVIGGFLGSVLSTDPSTDPAAPDGMAANTILTAGGSWRVLAIDPRHPNVHATNVKVSRFVIRQARALGQSTLATIGETQGAGVFVYVLDPEADIEFRDVRFRDNHARDSGGAVQVFSAAPFANGPNTPALKFVDCMFVNNHSATGAGLTALGGRIRLANCTFKRNGQMAESVSTPPRPTCFHGGGIALSGESTSLIAQNLLMYGNQARTGGGAIYIEPATAMAQFSEYQVVNCTIADNRTLSGVGGGQGGAGGIEIVGGATMNVYNPSAFPGPGDRAVVILNSIVWGNTNDDVRVRTQQINPAFPVEPGIAVYMAQSDIGESEDGTAGTPAGLVEVNVFDLDPLFIAPGNGNYRVQASVTNPSINSPCVDSGVDGFRGPDYCDVNADMNTSELLPLDREVTFRTIDLMSPNAQPGGQTIDVGAYEALSHAVPSGL